MIPIIYKGNVSPDYSYRAGFYGVSGIPAVFVSGYIDAGVGTYSSLEYYFLDLSNSESSLEITASYSSHPDEGIIIDAYIEVNENISTVNNKVLTFIANHCDYEYFAMETAGNQQDFLLSQSGSSGNYTAQLQLPSECDFENLDAVVIVQTFSGNNEILQAVRIPVNINAELNGTIIDAFSLLPLENALIECGSFVTHSDTDGNYSLELVNGNYNLHITCAGNLEYENSISIETGEQVSLDISLDERALPPNNLTGEWVDNDIVLSWNSPGVYTGFTETFESGELSENWQSTQNEGDGWIITLDGSSGGFDIPAHSLYIVSNDDAVNDDSSMDYLILPFQDFSRLFDVILSFDSYFTGNYDHSATIEVSIDEGQSWMDIYQIPSNNNWQNISVSLQEYCGSNYDHVLIAFHADDGGGWSSGWAVDNIVLGLGGEHRNLLGYNLYEEGVSQPLNNELIIEENYLLQNVVNEAHSFWVTAIYSSIESIPSNTCILDQTACDPDQVADINQVSVYPNPFNPSAKITFSISRKMNISLSIYNLKGQKCRTLMEGEISSGTYSFNWNGKDDNEKSVVSGIYFCRLQKDSYSLTKKMMLLK